MRHYFSEVEHIVPSDGTTSQSTRRAKNARLVAGYPGGRGESIRLKGVFVLLALLVSLSTPMLSQAAPPKPFTADYEVLRNGEKLGKATIRFAALPDGRFDLQTDTFGSEGLAAIAGVSIKERSLLNWNSKHLETISYNYEQKIAWKTREHSLLVDAKAGRILSTDKNGSRALPYQPGVLDRHAVTVALMQDLALGKMGELLYIVPDGDGLATQKYRPSPSEKIDTPLGSQRAVRIERIRDSGGGRSTTLWLGQDQGWVPLRLLQKEPDGETIEMRILSRLDSSSHTAR